MEIPVLCGAEAKSPTTHQHHINRHELYGIPSRRLNLRKRKHALRVVKQHVQSKFRVWRKNLKALLQCDAACERASQAKTPNSSAHKGMNADGETDSRRSIIRWRMKTTRWYLSKPRDHKKTLECTPTASDPDRRPF